MLGVVRACEPKNAWLDGCRGASRAAPCAQVENAQTIELCLAHFAAHTLDERTSRRLALARGESGALMGTEATVGLTLVAWLQLSAQ